MKVNTVEWKYFINFMFFSVLKSKMKNTHTHIYIFRYRIFFYRGQNFLRNDMKVLDPEKTIHNAND